ncbi:MAG: hypothetical protein RLZZ618_976 [Pseudomonadota bacterium]|jgi:hypothetical protein
MTTRRRARRDGVSCGSLGNLERVDNEFTAAPGRFGVVSFTGRHGRSIMTTPSFSTGAVARPATTRRRRFSVVLMAAAMVLAAGPTVADAAPVVPQRDDEVVAQLPTRLGSADARRQQRQAMQRLQQQPLQLPLALTLAREAIERARRWGDPRELGQAQAVLAPWWSLAEPPPAVRLLRATVLQSQHAFPAALADLNALLSSASVPLPIQAQAELTRSSVWQVQGRWAEAQEGCERLASARYASLGTSAQWPAQVCLAELMSLQGRAPQGAQRLDRLVRETGGSAPWITLVRAELAERRGQAGAEALYKQALRPAGVEQPEATDVYSLAAFSDWLLSQGRAREVVPLLVDRQDADALLLRLAIAWRTLGDERAAVAIRTLDERFDAASLRGDESHAREQARHALDLKDKPVAALLLAQANWAVQKEPADAVLLVRAALAAQRPEAAEPVWSMVRDTGFEDARLHALSAARKGTR